MSDTNCPQCGAEIGVGADLCQECGFELGKLENSIQTESPSMNKFNIKYWYFGVFPAFVCSAAAEMYLGTGPSLGIAIGFLMIRFASELKSALERWAVAVGGSLAFTFVVSLMRVQGSPMASHRFDNSQLIIQAIVAGVSGLIFYFIFVAILRWWLKRKQPK